MDVFADWEKHMSEIKKGETVRLKSGGPLMTVESVGSYARTGGPEEGALCVWFEKDKPKKEVFDTAMLVTD